LSRRDVKIALRENTEGLAYKKDGCDSCGQDIIELEKDITCRGRGVYYDVVFCMH